MICVRFDIRYRYAGHSFDPLPLPPLLAEAMTSASRVAGTTFNAVNVNVYDDGNSALARHRYVFCSGAAPPDDMLIQRFFAHAQNRQCVCTGEPMLFMET
eukprot:COSAG02_NODE_558_length_20348_cov_6.479431_4_plen_100_part_00